ncbi:ATP-dependent nuclease subunit B [Rhodovulum sp. PH10]|uniref:double-strand break repair protein AddB n=1 Tax=Rhodovulum sp. PH10 TaxID=1187851 RepID=UPI00027C270F|nr:double-strand break repair protein AddB [Rhodovulum sp. PH10]EJW13655.1 ATP-dependent nuclease subunit B [Rhodovulum sp. PH10]
MRRSSRVFTVPASVPFLPVLADALLDGALVPGFACRHDPAALAGATLYLPTRRACRIARDVFLDAMGGEAAMLPRIVALGDIDEDELAFSAAGEGSVAEGGAGEDEAPEGGLPEPLDLPPALPGLARNLLLARLVQTFAAGVRKKTGEPPLVVGTPAAALALAEKLARLIDDMTMRGVPWAALDGLVPDEHDVYWALTLDFLKIARDAWPAVLAERKTIEPAVRRDRLIAAEAARVARLDGPVVVAGSTGSIPVTARFIAAVAKLPHGAVVLPGLDTGLDDASWAAIAGIAETSGDIAEPESGHPQFALHGLLETLGLSRAEVAVLGEPGRHDRAVLFSEALRPAATTHLWQARLIAEDFGKALTSGLPGLSVIEAATAEEEALAIAVVLREVLETPGRTAALATPDRALARRVAAALGRWHVTVADTGGTPLADTPAGVFARLAVETALGGVAPVPLLALLKHPLVRLGAPEHGFAHAVGTLERAVLRGPRPRAGTAGLAHALATVREELEKARAGEPSAIHRADPRASLADADLAAAERLAERLAAALGPLENLDSRKPQSLKTLAEAHAAVVAALADDGAGEVAAFEGPDGRALAAFFTDLAADVAAESFQVRLDDYGELFRTAIADRIVRQPPVTGARLQILGLLEARLVAVDRMVLGGLAEGVWPPAPSGDPWLSRGMRLALGLDLPERRIGLSAHDFAQLAGSAPEVVLTRSAKVGGAPAAASRFLQRLAAVAGPAWQDAVARGEKYLGFARALDRPTGPPQRAARPEPRPPREARPVSLSVTEIEHWLRDPYTIYAKHVLALAPLDPVDLPPGAKDRGTAIHAAVAAFATQYSEALPKDPFAELLAIGRETFAPLDDYPEARAFWWPRFVDIARWVADFERGRRESIATLRAEIRGTLDIPVGERVFRLVARADRIEKHRDGTVAILDFKTGIPPSSKQVRLGLSPQLTLEGAVLRRGGFSDFPAGLSLAELAHVRLKGGEPAGDFCAVAFEDVTADAAADKAFARLVGLIARFEDPETPYRSLVRSMWKTRYGTYDDLARVKEWSAGEGDGE